MKRIALLPVLALLFACERDTASQATIFSRTYDFQGNSSLNDVLELENGNLLLCGKVAKPAFISTASSEITEGRLEEPAPALILTDAEGRILKSRLFPINDVVVDPSIVLNNLYGSARFLQVYGLSNGGFIVAGEFRGFGFDIPHLNNFSSPPSPGTNSPFIARFNANLEMVDFRHFNSTIPWDSRLYGNGVLKPKPEGNGFIYMLGFTFGFPGGFLGYQLIDLNAEGEEVQRNSFFDFNEIKFARDFTFLEDGTIVVVGQEGGYHYSFQVDPISLIQFRRRRIADDGTGEQFNNNPILVEALPDGRAMCFYTDPVEKNYVQFLDSGLDTLGRFDLEPELIDQYHYESTVCADGDILLSCTDLTDASLERSLIYRIRPDGRVMWRRAYDGRVQQLEEAQDGRIFVLADLFYSGGKRVATLYKINGNGQLQ